MPGLILNDADRDYASIRRVILAGLDEDATTEAERLLSDAVIEDQVYLDAGEAEVTALYPDITALLAAEAESEEVDGDPMTALQIATLATVRRSTVYLVAARLSPAVPIVVEETFREHRYKTQVETTADRTARLRGEGLALLTSLSEAIETGGRRGSRFRRAGVRNRITGRLAVA